MKVSKSKIAKLNPCKSRFDNYVKNYKSKEFTVKQFLALKKITHADKLWVAFRLMPKGNIRLAAADIAESVLHIFEQRYPNDDRPRKAIEAARKGNAAASAAYDAAYNAAYDATSAAYAAYGAAHATANAAAHAASAAAHAAYDATGAAYAAYDAAHATASAAAHAASAAAHAAYAAAHAAYDAAHTTTSAAAHAAYAAPKAEQEKLIRKIILKYWK